MAKLFYTAEEAAAKLNVTPVDLRHLTFSGQLQEFRDRDRLMYKVDQIDLIASHISDRSLELDEPDSISIFEAEEPTPDQLQTEQRSLGRGSLLDFNEDEDKDSDLEPLSLVGDEGGALFESTGVDRRSTQMTARPTIPTDPNEARQLIPTADGIEVLREIDSGLALASNLKSSPAMALLHVSTRFSRHEKIEPGTAEERVALQFIRGLSVGEWEKLEPSLLEAEGCIEELQHCRELVLLGLSRIDRPSRKDAETLKSGLSALHGIYFVHSYCKEYPALLKAIKNSHSFETACMRVCVDSGTELALTKVSQLAEKCLGNAKNRADELRAS